MTFDQFTRQYHASGREKLDGYTSSTFDGMTLLERRKAESLLIEAAERGDTTAYQGLALIGTSTARAVLKRIHASLHPPSFSHLHASEFLYKISPDENYQREIGKNLATNNDMLYEQTVITLSYTKSTSYFLKTMREILLATDKESTAHSVAASALIRYFGFPPLTKDQTPDRLALERKVMAADKSTIDAIQDEVKQLAQQRGFS